MAPTENATVSTVSLVTSPSLTSSPALSTSSRISTMVSTPSTVQSNAVSAVASSGYDFLGKYKMGSNLSNMSDSIKEPPTESLRQSFCDFGSGSNQIYLFGGIGVGLAIILAFTAQRVRLRPDILRGRPGLLIPVNLLESRSNRFVYVMAFCSMTAEIIQLVFDGFTGASSNPWTKTLLVIAYVFLYSGAFSIVVMSIEPPHRLIGYSFGLIYSLFAAGYRIPFHFLCEPSGLGVGADILLALPSVCIAYLILWFAYKLLREVLLLTGMLSTPSTIHDNPPYHMEYVRKTLARPKKEETQSTRGSWITRFVKRHIYKPDPTFKYSTRMLVTVAVSAIAIWELAVTFSGISIILSDFARSTRDTLEDSVSGTGSSSTEEPIVSFSPSHGPVSLCDRASDIYSAILGNQPNTTCDYTNNTIYYKYSGVVIYLCSVTNSNSSAYCSNPFLVGNNGTNSTTNSDDDENQLDFIVDLVRLLADALPLCLGFAIACTTLLTAVHLPHLLTCYRQDMKRLYRGDTSFLPKSKTGPVGLVTSSLKYSGLQIGYVLWGWVILLLILFLVFLIIAFCLHYKFVSFLDIFLKFLPTIVFTIVLIIGQFLLAKFVLLRERGKYLGIDNRRLFHMFGYFFFFYNTLVGIFSCLKRLIIGLALGTVMINRLDLSTLPRGWEVLDKGYKSYVGFLLLEHAFCNPYLVTFIYIVQQATSRQPASTEVELKGAHVNSEKFVGYRSRLVRNRWLVAYTLINNPSLLANRRIDKSEHCMLITRKISKSPSAASEVYMNGDFLETDKLKGSS